MDKTKRRIGMSRVAVGGLLTVAMLVMLTGCNSQAPPLSQNEKADFKGGPMPKDYKDPFLSGSKPPTNTQQPQQKQ